MVDCRDILSGNIDHLCLLLLSASLSKHAHKELVVLRRWVSRLRNELSPNFLMPSAEHTTSLNRIPILATGDDAH
ncbi:MAG: hypothetical protein ACTS73_03610 [Arsenophonus sp. NEOnobi-MAG3]